VEVTGQWIKLHNEELHDLLCYCPSDTVHEMKKGGVG
jgi:hypothetical protein